VGGKKGGPGEKRVWKNMKRGVGWEESGGKTGSAGGHMRSKEKGFVKENKERKIPNWGKQKKERDWGMNRESKVEDKQTNKRSRLDRRRKAKG